MVPRGSEIYKIRSIMRELGPLCQYQVVYERVTELGINFNLGRFIRNYLTVYGNEPTEKNGIGYSEIKTKKANKPNPKEQTVNIPKPKTNSINSEYQKVLEQFDISDKPNSENDILNFVRFVSMVERIGGLTKAKQYIEMLYESQRDSPGEDQSLS